MPDRSTARHRASQRPLTPLDSLGQTLTGQLTAVTDQFGSVTRNGAVLALSTGLVATMGLPASAVVKTAPENGASFARSSVVSAAAVSLPASVVGGAAVTASDAAKVSFERDALSVRRAAPKPKPTARPRVVEKASRSSTRSTTTKTTKTTTKTTTRVKSAAGASRSAAVNIARQYLGIPYRYGGTTTAGFDCSGFSKFVYAKIGVTLPRTSSAQYAATRRVSRSEALPGDIVFFFSGGRVTHLGIYTGGNMMIDSPRSGKSTSERAIWSSNVAFGRP
ncbi:MAG: C40 family peptidase [Kineosporiaceae bacterium]